MQLPAGPSQANVQHYASATELKTRPPALGAAREEGAGGEEALLEGLRRLCEGGPWIYAALWQHRNGKALGLQPGEGQAGAFSQRSERLDGTLVCTLFHCKRPEEERRPVDFEALHAALTHLRMLEFERGEGILGESADSGEGDRWLSASPSGYRVRPAVATGASDKGDDHWRAQFSAGLETVLLTSFQGCLLQLGSTEKLPEDPAIAVQARTVFLPFFAAAISSSLDPSNPRGFPKPLSPYDPRSPFGIVPDYPPQSFDYQPQALTDPWKAPSRNPLGPGNPFVPSKHSSRLAGGGSSFRGGSPSMLAVSRTPAGQFRDRPSPPHNSRPPVLPFTGIPLVARPILSTLDGPEQYRYSLGGRSPGASVAPFPNHSEQHRRLHEAAALSRDPLQLDLEAPPRLETQTYGPGQALPDGAYGAFQGRSADPREAFASLSEAVVASQSRGGEFGAPQTPSLIVNERASDLLGRIESLGSGERWQGATPHAPGSYEAAQYYQGDERLGGSLGSGVPLDRRPRGGEGSLLPGAYSWPGAGLSILGALGHQATESWKERSRIEAELLLERGSREDAFRVQESFLRLQEQLEMRRRDRPPLVLPPGGGSLPAPGREHAGRDDDVMRILKGEAAAQDVRFAWTPELADERPPRGSANGTPSKRADVGFAYEEIYTPRSQDQEAQDDSSGAERSLLLPSLSSRESEGGAEKGGGGRAGAVFGGGVGRAWSNEAGTPTKRLADMETIFENEPVALRPWEKGRQTWYTNLDHLRALVPDTSLLKLEDLLDRVATHISHLRARIAFRSNKARAKPFGKYVDLPWTVSPEKSFFVEDLDSSQLVLIEAFLDSEESVPALAHVLCKKGELCFTVFEAFGKHTRARFIVKMISAMSTDDLLSGLKDS